jgi:hypothetical protein
LLQQINKNRVDRCSCDLPKSCCLLADCHDYARARCLASVRAGIVPRAALLLMPNTTTSCVGCTISISAYYAGSQ